MKNSMYLLLLQSIICLGSQKSSDQNNIRGLFVEGRTEHMFSRARTRGYDLPNTKTIKYPDGTVVLMVSGRKEIIICSEEEGKMKFEVQPQNADQHRITAKMEGSRERAIAARPRALKAIATRNMELPEK